MSAEPDEPLDEEAQRGWKERLAIVADAGASLLQTRVAIFREELSQKLILVARGAAAVVIAAILAASAMLLLAAFLAALFTKLFGSVVLGILATLLLYAAIAAGTAYAGIKSLSRVRLTEFPASQEELRRDVSALRASWAASPGEVSASPEPSPEESPRAGPPEGSGRGREAAVESLEERYRAGAE